jgi:hypothetical protein
MQSASDEKRLSHPGNLQSIVHVRSRYVNKTLG